MGSERSVTAGSFADYQQCAQGLEVVEAQLKLYQREPMSDLRISALRGTKPDGFFFDNSQLLIKLVLGPAAGLSR